MADERELRIEVPALTRVEGEGALEIEVAAGRIRALRLRIYEPPRLFERLLEGRSFEEVPDLVARICGICPVAYQMSAVHAFETLFGCEPGPWVRRMRRALYCGEWIESHSLHIHLLAAPDLYGCESVVELSRRDPEAVRRGLALQALGNDLIALFGGRSVHPVGVRAGGFHAAPRREAVAALQARCEDAVPEAEALVDWAAGLERPRSPQALRCLALSHPDEYPMNEGELACTDGTRFAFADFERHVEERQVPHSTALHALLGGEPYLTGPVARLNLNHDRLHPVARAALARSGLALPVSDLNDAMVVRAVEVLHAVAEAAELLRGYEPPERPFAEARPRAGTTAWATEAPRGVLWHRYEVDGEGIVRGARIVPPTSQNQAHIETTLRATLEAGGLERAPEVLRAEAERTVRHYDPCISCATHFLDLRIREAGAEGSPSG